LPDLVKNFYFFTSNKYFDRFDDTSSNKTEYFIYTPNPPMQEFNYSLVKVDKTYKILSTILEFDNNEPWSKFDLNLNLDSPNAMYAIKLRIIDTINKNNITLFKVLK
jgi:hypothetical protein